MNTPARQFLVDFVLGHADSEPLAIRVKLYRALASELPGSCPEYTALTQAADALEDAEARTEQLLLNLRGGAR
ncbi:MAG: hypothetical protein IPL39_14550 [Opitutaceae bacterium]|nr:hypothetical protein [Opitutaceae bacterium]